MSRYIFKDINVERECVCSDSYIIREMQNKTTDISGTRQNSDYQTDKRGTREMGQWLGAPTVPPEDPGLIVSLYTASHNCL